jgi:hypothetical protein
LDGDDEPGEEVEAAAAAGGQKKEDGKKRSADSSTETPSNKKSKVDLSKVEAIEVTGCGMPECNGVYERDRSRWCPRFVLRDTSKKEQAVLGRRGKWYIWHVGMMRKLYSTKQSGKIQGDPSLTCEEWQAHPHNAILPLPTLKVHSMST